ncbi:MAG: hypothetical protein J0H88_24370 [Sphingomonadales bacterium]|nr:hypothetical protein [Sphingomonadales bacterium]
MLSAILSLALAAASANAAAPEGTTTTQPAKPAKPKKVCEKIEITGSTVPKRVCRTVVEPAQPKGEAVRADAGKAQPGATD